MYAKITCVCLCLCILQTQHHTSNQTHSHAKSSCKHSQYKLTQTHTHIRVHSYTYALPPPLSHNLSLTPARWISCSLSLSQQVHVEDAFPPMELTCSKIPSPNVFLCFPFLFKSCELFQIVYHINTIGRRLELLYDFRESPVLWTPQPLSLSLSNFLFPNTHILTHTRNFTHSYAHTCTQKTSIHIMLVTFVARLLLQVPKQNYYLICL